MALGGFGIIELEQVMPGPVASFTITPPSIPNNTPTPQQLTLTGTNTTWTQNTIFDVAGVQNLAKVGQTIISATSALLFVTTGAGFGVATVTETVTGNASANFTVQNVPVTPPVGGGTPGTETDEGHSKRVLEYAYKKFLREKDQKGLTAALHAMDDELLLVELLTGAIGDRMFGRVG